MREIGAFDMRVTVRVKKLMRLREVSADEAAAAFGVTRRTFDRWMRDGRRWMADDLWTAKQLFRTSIEYLFGKTDDPNPQTPDEPHDGVAAMRA